MSAVPKPSSEDKKKKTLADLELSEEDVSKLKDAFKLFDADDSGSIEHAELLEIFVSLDPRITKDEFSELMQEYDEDGDGTIDWIEFQILMAPAICSGDGDETTEEDLKAAFEIADADGGGSIDKQELGDLLATLGEVLSDLELTALMNEIDVDGSGEIEFDEFKELFAALSEDPLAEDIGM